MVAWPAEANKLAFVTLTAVVLAKRIISPAADNMIIMIMEGICTFPAAFTAKPGVNPGVLEKEGNRSGNDPRRTTRPIAEAKITTDLIAPGARVTEAFSSKPSRFLTKT